jgi:hypothetical protein
LLSENEKSRAAQGRPAGDCSLLASYERAVADMDAPKSGIDMRMVLAASSNMILYSE